MLLFGLRVCYWLASLEDRVEYWGHFLFHSDAAKPVAYLSVLVEKPRYSIIQSRKKSEGLNTSGGGSPL